jgi:hypothetical protein
VKKALSLLVVLMFLCSTIVAPVMANTPQVSTVLPGNVYIPKGTLVKAELITSVNSGKNKVNDVVLFKTTEALILNGTEVIPKGTTGEAIVSKIKKAGAFGKGGGIELQARSIKTLNGVDAPLTMDVQKYGGGQGMLVPWLLVGVFSGFITGKNQDIPAGTKFQVAIDSDTDLGVPVGKLAEAMAEGKTVAVTVQ